MHIALIAAVVPVLWLLSLIVAGRVDATTTAATTTTTTTIPEPGRSHHDEGAASWYGAAEGKCAHRTIAAGTPVRVINASTGATTRCKVASWGPSDQRRVIDLSKATYARLADPSRGIVQVKLEW